MEKTTYQYGLWAEFLSAWFLRLRGYRILACRYKTPVGEVDIIARRKNVLVFVEVKARRSLDEATFSLSPRMQNRITRAAQYYVSQHPQCANMFMRFDLLAFAPLFRFRHLDNAWMSAP